MRFDLLEGQFFKIGITTKGVPSRFSRHSNKPTVLSIREFSNGKEAFLEEQRILHKFSAYSYKDPNVIPEGNSELFVKDMIDEF